MSSPAADTDTLTRRPETPPKPLAHLWHTECQGTSPGVKFCYCGARITVQKSSPWDGKAEYDDCVVCVELFKAKHCPLCKGEGQ